MKDEIKDVHPIRDYEKVLDMKWALNRFCGERDFILFLLGINIGMRVKDLLDYEKMRLSEKRKSSLWRKKQKKPEPFI